MDKQNLLALYEKIRTGEITPEEALLKTRMEPFDDLGFAKVDHHRTLRQGTPEVIWGQGKTAKQMIAIVENMLSHGQKNVLITRLSSESAAQMASSLPLNYHAQSRLGIIGEMPAPTCTSKIVVATGGTSDIPVAEEAALTAEVLGSPVVRLYDVGVAGLHRLLSRLDIIMQAKVIIAVAGMEGALASVIGGLVDCPVIAVPTSIGYGASFQGMAALLSMLNSCSSGVSVVNIDNGFGAGYLANMINHI